MKIVLHGLKNWRSFLLVLCVYCSLNCVVIV